MANQHVSVSSAQATGVAGEQVVRDVLARLEAHARGMWRYRWRAVLVAWTVCVVGWTGVFLMPPVYEANARIFVDTENALRPLLGGIAATTNVLNEVTVVTREMLSRPNLADVARATNLDLRANSDAEFEDLLSALNKRIQVVGGRDNIYSIAYQDPDRSMAVAIVDALVRTFVEKSLGADRSDTSQAQSFLQSQIDEYEQRLIEAEDRLAEFKRENVAYMPDQRGDYFERLQNAKAELSTTSSELQLAQRRREELVRQLEGEEPVFGIMSQEQSPASASSGFTATKIRDLELELEELRLQFTDKHPRITQIMETIEFLKREQSKNQSQVSVAGAEGGGAAITPLDQNPVYQNMRIQLSNTEVDIASLQARLQQARNRVSELQRVVDTVPQVEASLGRLNRDYDIIKAKYEQFLNQLETANIGEDVEASIDNVKFRIIDPPFSDLKPAGPHRNILAAGILLGALGAGIALTFLFNQLHPVYFSSRDITSTFNLPVLGAVSLMMSPDQKRSKQAGRVRFAISVILLFGTFALVWVFSESVSPLLRSVAGMDV
jgi:polysaccharide chain length determinant protein (PEP-CTERM system associated)